MMESYSTFIALAYALAAVLLGGITLLSWLKWLRVRRDLESLEK